MKKASRRLELKPVIVKVKLTQKMHACMGSPILEQTRLDAGRRSIGAIEDPSNHFQWRLS
jgi:hypothetical protein